MRTYLQMFLIIYSLYETQSAVTFRNNMGFKQRYMHFYFVNEVVHLLFLVGAWNFFGSYENEILMPSREASGKQEYIRRLLARWLLVGLSYGSFYILNFAVMAVILLYRRQFRPSGRLVASIARKENIKPIPVFGVSEHVTSDGVKLRVLCTKTQRKGKKSSKKVMLLGLPLGQKGEASFAPILAHFGDEYVYVTWHYRGMFNSADPNTERRMSMTHHAMDAKFVLQKCGYDYCDVFIGHSMGCAVAFETVLLYPDLVGSLVIINGFHGHVFSTAFQPLARLPFFRRLRRIAGRISFSAPQPYGTLTSHHATDTRRCTFTVRAFFSEVDS